MLFLSTPAKLKQNPYTIRCSSWQPYTQRRNRWLCLKAVKFVENPTLPQKKVIFGRVVRLMSLCCHKKDVVWHGLWAEDQPEKSALLGGARTASLQSRGRNTYSAMWIYLAAVLASASAFAPHQLQPGLRPRTPDASSATRLRAAADYGGLQPNRRAVLSLVPGLAAFASQKAADAKGLSAAVLQKLEASDGEPAPPPTAAAPATAQTPAKTESASETPPAPAPKDEAASKAKAEQDAKKAEEAEKKRVAAEAESKRRAEEEAEKRVAAEAESKRLAEEEAEKKRVAEEAAEAKAKADAEAAEAEAAKKAQEQAASKARAEEKRKADAAANAEKKKKAEAAAAAADAEVQRIEAELNKFKGKANVSTAFPFLQPYVRLCS